MSAPNTFENSLRLHDTAVYTWLRTLLVDYGTVFGALRNAVPIIVTQATPDRAFANLVDQLVAMEWMTAVQATAWLESGRSMEQLPLPACTYTRSDPVNDTSMAGVAKFLHSATGVNDPNTGKPYRFQMPAHYKIEYVASFWCNKKFTEAALREWLYSQFGVFGCHPNERLLTVFHNPPFSPSHQSFRMEGFVDNSVLEGSDQRYQRFDVTFNLRAWFIKPPLASIPLGTTG